MNLTIPAAFLFFGLSVGSRADLTLEQKMEGGPQSGDVVMRVKGDKFRLDMPGGTRGRLSTIVDVKTGDTITLIHSKKISITRKGRKSQPGQDEKNLEPPKPNATRLKELVGEYEAEIYTLPADDSKETLWVVREFPDFAAIKEDLMRVGRASSGGINRAGTLDLTTLPGMVVKRQKERGGQKMTITLTGARRDPIEDAVFEIPAEYKPVTPPSPAITN